MQPYYDDGQTTIYHGDMQEVVPHLEAVDLIIADPPYGETSLAWDRWVPQWPTELPTHLKSSGSLWCFGSMRMFLEHGGDFAFWHFVQDVVWEKHNGSGFQADRFKRVHEHVVQWIPVWTQWADVYKSPVLTYDATARVIRKRQQPSHTGEIGETCSYTTVDGGPRLMRSVIPVRSCNGYAEHPTQKPEGIIVPLIEYSCPPNGVVLDLFSGSGTVARVAKNLGRRCISIEINEAYCEIAAKRLRQQVLPLDLGA